MYALIGSIIIFFAGYCLTNSYEFGICFSSTEANIFDVSCHQMFERVGNPLFHGGAALAIVFALLYAFPHAFSVWKKFAIWFIPLAVLLFIFYPNPGSGDFLAPMPEQLFQWVSALYVIVSAIIIGVASRR